MHKILIVDSNKDYHLIYRRKLRALKGSLTFSCNIKEAKLKIDKKDFDFIIIEHLLRKEIGTEVYDSLREQGYSGPIMVMTYDKTANRDHYNGIIRMLHKSTPAKELCNTILDLMFDVKDNAKIREGV